MAPLNRRTMALRTYELPPEPLLLLASGGANDTAEVDRIRSVVPFSVAPLEVRRHEIIEAARAQLNPILLDGSFLFSPTGVDLSLRLERRVEREIRLRREAFQPLARDASDVSPEGLLSGKPYVWNAFLLAPFLDVLAAQPPAVQQRVQGAQILLALIRGYHDSRQVVHGGVPLELTLISRRDWHREGTRFAERGIDAEGYVANFAEVRPLTRQTGCAPD